MGVRLVTACFRLYGHAEDSLWCDCNGDVGLPTNIGECMSHSPLPGSAP
jgi:hypothetical protein